MAIVRNIHTNDYYEYLGENQFVNLRTEVKGYVPTEKAQSVFVIDLDATEMFMQNENIKTLISKLKLSAFANK